MLAFTWGNDLTEEEMKLVSNLYNPTPYREWFLGTDMEASEIVPAFTPCKYCGKKHTGPCVCKTCKIIHYTEVLEPYEYEDIEQCVCLYCDTTNIHNKGHYCIEVNKQLWRNHFKSWTSGDDRVDTLIKESQINANNAEELIEWIPYSEFTNLKRIGQGAYGVVYVANWQRGPLEFSGWDPHNKSLDRWGFTQVAIKQMKGGKELSSAFLSEVSRVLVFNSQNSIGRIHGLTYIDSTDKNSSPGYAMVMEYHKYGDMRRALRKVTKNELYKGRDKTFSQYLHDFFLIVAEGLSTIHEKGFCHRDIHPGNILSGGWYANFPSKAPIFRNELEPVISDFGLCMPVNEHLTSYQVYGVLPFMAPEVLNNGKFTQASDIYSFGMIMYEGLAGVPPFVGQTFDLQLSLKIINGERPPIPTYAPSFYQQLIESCWNADPLKRPTASELVKKLNYPLSPNKRIQDTDITELISVEQEKQWKDCLLDEENAKRFQHVILYSTAIDTSNHLGNSNIFDTGASCQLELDTAFQQSVMEKTKEESK